MDYLRRYLTHMGLFLAAVAVLVLLLSRTVLNAFRENIGLNALILGIATLGIVYMVRQVMRLRTEVQWLEGYQATGAAPDDIQPILLAPLSQMLGERRNRLSLSAPAMRSLLDGLGSRLDESRELSRYLTGLLIFLGLLGTFWGLLGTIGGVARVLGGLDLANGDVTGAFESLKNGLRDPLTGMGTAFSASLFGLAGSLVLGFLDLQAGQAQNRFFMQVEDWLAGVTRLGGGPVGESGEAPIPVYVQALLEQTAENMENLQRIVGQSEEGRRIANNSVVTLTEKLSLLSDQMRAEQQLLVRLGESQLELKGVLSKLSDTLAHERGGSGGMDDAARQHLRNIDVYMARLLEDTAQGRTQALAEIRSDIKMVARTVAALAGEER